MRGRWRCEGAGDDAWTLARLPGGRRRCCMDAGAARWQAPPCIRAPQGAPVAAVLSPVSRAPSAPACLATPTSSSSSGQLQLYRSLHTPANPGVQAAAGVQVPAHTSQPRRAGSCRCTGLCGRQPTQVCRQLQVYRSLRTAANPGVQAAAGVQVSADGSQPRCAGSCRCTGHCGRQPTQACRQLQVYRSLRTAANPGMQAAAWPDLRGDCCGAHLQLAWLASMSAPSSASFWAGALSLSHTALNACTLQPAASRRRAV